MKVDMETDTPEWAQETLKGLGNGLYMESQGGHRFLTCAPGGVGKAVVSAAAMWTLRCEIPASRSNGLMLAQPNSEGHGGTKATTKYH